MAIVLTGVVILITISLCMIVRNEEAVLGRCLDSVRDIPDEILIVDIGSTDSTKEIASEYTDKIYDFAWIDDFSAARNYAFSLATKEYILWLDADDVLPESDYEKMCGLKESLQSSIDVVFMPYALTTDNQGHYMHVIQRNRLVKRSRNFHWHGVVDEDLEAGGRAMISDIYILHQPVHPKPDCHVEIYTNLCNRGIELSPRDLMNYGNYFFKSGSFEQAARLYVKFLDTKKGSAVENIIACRQLGLCYEKLGDREHELHYLLKSFEFDTPRAELCCLLGRFFGRHGNWSAMEFWFELAYSLNQPKEPLGPLDEVYRTWYPHKQLAYVYCQKAQYKDAYNHVQEALNYNPSDEQLQHLHWLLDKLTRQRTGHNR